MSAMLGCTDSPETFDKPALKLMEVIDQYGDSLLIFDKTF